MFFSAGTEGPEYGPPLESGRRPVLLDAGALPPASTVLTFSGPLPAAIRAATALVSSRRIAAFSRCSGRLPHTVSGAPKLVLLPWLMYRAPSGPKSLWLVRWSRTLRGRLTT